MASGLISTRPQSDTPSTPGQQGQYEDFIQKRLEHTRRQVRTADVATGLMLLAAASLVFFLAVAVLDQWVFKHGLNFLARLGLFAVWVAAAAAFIWRILTPAIANRINPVFAAQALEHGRPTLKNSLINFLMLRGHPQDVAPVVYRAMEHRAASDLLKVPVDTAVDRGRMVQLAYMLAAVVGVFALYLALSPKNPLISAARVIWPWSGLAAPTRVHFDEIQPGDAVVFNGDRQEITAHVTGLHDGEEVALVWSTADGQVVDDRLMMTRVDDANHYRCELPPGNGGFQQDTFYRLSAGDAVTQQFKLNVQIAPTIIVDQIDYHFPAYTEWPDRSVKNQGDIKALEGTRVTIHATANMEIQSARIEMNSGLQTVKMSANGTKASGQFTLTFDPESPSKPQDARYQVSFTDTQGHVVRRPVQYQINVDEDLRPKIEITKPLHDVVRVAEDGELQIHVHAKDLDFVLRRVGLQAECGDRKLPLPVLLDREPPQKGPQNFDGDYTFRPAAFGLKAGDEVHYWAEAEDNKEPRRPRPERQPEQMTIEIVGRGQDGRQDPQDQQNHDDGQASQDRSNPQQNSGQGKSSEQGRGDESKKGGSDSQQGEPKPDEKGDGKTQAEQSRDPKAGGSKDQGKSENNSGAGKDNPSSNSPSDPKSGDASKGEAGDEVPKHLDQKTQSADAIREMLNDKAKNDQQNQPEQSSGAEQPDKKQDPTQQDSSQQNSSQQNTPQQNSPQKGNEKSDGGQGQQPQGNSGEKKDQGDKSGGSPQAGQKPGGGQGNEQKPGASGDKKDQGGNSSSQPDASGQNKPGEQQGGQPKSDNQGGQGNQPKTWPDPKSGGSQPKDGSQGKDPQSSGGAKSDQANGGGQQKPESKPGSGEKSHQGQSAGGEKPDKKQGGSEQSKSESVGGGSPPKSDKQKPGGQGGDEQQLAQNDAKPDTQPKPAGGGSSDKPMPGGSKDGKKPGQEKGNSQGGGQDSKPKAEKQEGGGGSESQGGKDPKPGDGEKPGGGSPKPGGQPSGKKGGTAHSEEPGQKYPGKSGETSEDSSGAPSPQVDPDRSGQKSGDSHNSLDQKSDKSQSPGNSKKDSNSSSQSKGDRKGGGGEGGGQHDKKAGKGAPGSQTSAKTGGQVSDEQGDDATGKKAGQEARASDRTGSSKKESGKGDGKKTEPTDDKTAKDDGQKPQSESAQNTSESENKSSGGEAGKESSQQAGQAGAGLPSGGSPGTVSGTPPVQSQNAEHGADAANLSFSKKQVDLALSHLKEEMKKNKPELLDHLGWTKEEAQRFYDNMEKLKDTAQRPGNDGADAKKAYNEFLKNLDLHPHGTQIQGGGTKTDDLRGVRDSGQSEPPSEYADQVRQYLRSTGGQR